MSPVLNGQIVTANTGPPPDPAKLHFDLKSRFNDKAKPGAQYTVVFPPEQLPSNTQGVFWIVEEPNKPTRTFAMHHYSCLVHSEIPGLHKVHVEFHGTGDQIKVVSNTVEMTFPTPQKP